MILHTIKCCIQHLVSQHTASLSDSDGHRQAQLCYGTEVHTYIRTYLLSGLRWKVLHEVSITPW